MYHVLSVVHVAGAVVATVHLLVRYRRASAAVAWLFAFWWIPILAWLVYALFFAQREPREIRRRRARAQILRAHGRSGTVPGVPYPEGTVPPGFAEVAEAVAAFPLCGGNRVDVLADGDAVFEAMLEAIRGAREEVCLATYILETGIVTHALREALEDRVRAGVKVRLLYDQAGSVSLPGSYLDGLEDAGVSVAGFLRPSPLKGRFQLNFRNHRKILVVDRDVAFTGGQNWGDGYSASRNAGRLLLDLHVRLVGPAAAGVRRVFLEDWSLATGDAIEEHPAPGPAGDLCVRVIPHGPDEENERLTTVLAAAITSARRRVLLVTPYFVPGETMRAAVRLAALRGAKVTLLVPRRSDILLADLAARRHFGTLFDAGVEIRRLEGPFLHAKALVVDGSWATLGSANYDQRSFAYNYELNLEIADTDFAQGLEAHFAPLLERAEPIDPGEFAERSVWRRAVENAANLFEPML